MTVIHSKANNTQETRQLFDSLIVVHQYLFREEDESYFPFFFFHNGFYYDAKRTLAKLHMYKKSSSFFSSFDDAVVLQYERIKERRKNKVK